MKECDKLSSKLGLPHHMKSAVYLMSIVMQYKLITTVLIFQRGKSQCQTVLNNAGFWHLQTLQSSNWI